MWAIYALLSAFFAATTDPIAKSALKQSDEYFVGWAMLSLSTPFLAILYFFGPRPPFDPGLVTTILIAIPFEITALILYYRALRLTDISLSVPFLALTPVFAVLTAFLLLGERIRPAGGLGIALVAIGAYSMNLGQVRNGLSHPIRAIFRNRGSFYMVLAALIFSITSAVAKKAMLFSNPESIPFIYNLSISLAMAPIVLLRLKRNPAARPVLNRRTVPAFLGLGLCLALSCIFFFRAVSLANVAYTISMKRLSLLISVGYGWLIFRERDIHLRFLSAFCMVFGAVLLVVSS